MAVDTRHLGARFENVYAHRKRLAWIKGFLHPADRIVELGCGTGYMLTLPLLAAGFDVVGLDRDPDSIAYGRRLARQTGLAEDRLLAGDLESLAEPVDVVIASEVLEHLDDGTLGEVLAAVGTVLRPGGRLLITVPNGYGWYEFEAFLWHRLGLGRAFTALRADRALTALKMALTGKEKDDLIDVHPSTFDDSPHLQRFTLRGIRDKVAASGYRVLEATGSALFAGQFSNALFTGYDGLTGLNARLGARLPALAAGFFVACVRDQPVVAASSPR